ncbi:MAG: PQQ-like beta-propeller repeat protein [Verrucomicrobia bacterium]|nr:PQQ-like beta-propeller repeat protein [Verrucomicrobiota bacterium]
MNFTGLLLSVTLSALIVSTRADDWPQWMGPRRDDVWRERGIVQQFASNGPPVLWRVAIADSYSGPAVVGQRLFMMDRPKAAEPQPSPGEEHSPKLPARERVLCLDATTGKKIWEHAYPREYNIGYPAGPRTTPTVADGRVYTLGAMGDLLCLQADTGEVVWERHFLKDYQPVKPPVWGWAGHPLLDGDRLICLVGGTNTAVVAFHKDTGRELWRALTAVEIGYAPPVIYTVQGRRQLIIWHPDAVSGLDPESGKVFWSQPYPIGGEPKRPEVTIALPRLEGDRLFLTCFYQGSLLLQLTADGAKLAWNRRSTSDSEMNDGLHTVLGTPVFRDGFIYGVCGFGELRCLDAKTGDRKWETYAATGGKSGFFANVFITENEGRTFLYNDQGEMIIAKLRPNGYQELSRVKLLEPLEKTRGRTVTWCHPAYANRCAYVHNGKELICVSLAAG